VIEGLFADPLSVVHLDEHLARRAAELRIEHCPARASEPKAQA
jgi:hypothetical protein